MIRKQASPQPLFYSSQEISQPAAGNFYLRLDTAVKDWDKLAAPFAPAFSAGRGRPTDPVVYLKIFLIGYFENICYDTDLAERIADSLAIRRFLGYCLSEAPPDHSSISRNRGRIGQHCRIEEVLAQVVELCKAQGLVEGKETALDGTLIPANASLSSLRSVKTNQTIREHLRAVREHNPQAKATLNNDEFRSTSDPDARIAKKGAIPADMCYLASHLTDAKAGIILGAELSLADAGEIEPAQAAIEQAQAHLQTQGEERTTVVADAGYDAGEFHAWVEEQGLIPLTNYTDRNQKPAGLQKRDFSYDAPADCYLCPAGKPLAYQDCDATGRRRYRSRISDCKGCAMRGDCIGKGRRRSIFRMAGEESRERNIARCHSEAGRAALRRRRHIVEPPFGHLKTYGGMGLINCRGKAKAKVKVVLAAVAWDLIKLVKAISRGQQSAKGELLVRYFIGCRIMLLRLSYH